MIVVADTSPLNYLIRLRKAEILPDLYGRVVVPRAVLSELQHPRAPEPARSWAATPPAWLEVVRVRAIDPTLMSELGIGEREAISVAIELRADLLLIDERLGRKAAEGCQLQVAGTLAVLLQAALRNLLDFSSVLQEIQQLGFRVSREVETTILAAYQKQRKL